MSYDSLQKHSQNQDNQAKPAAHLLHDCAELLQVEPCRVGFKQRVDAADKLLLHIVIHRLSSTTTREVELRYAGQRHLQHQWTHQQQQQQQECQ